LRLGLLLWSSAPPLRYSAIVGAWNAADMIVSRKQPAMLSTSNPEEAAGHAFRRARHHSRWWRKQADGAGNVSWSWVIWD